ncbi:MAG TPA: hypothetical protein VM889_14285 [Candidatus Thermoplasmatota archaeon]|jgi:hypothetical protein|nr:hypothetical protein [Candidatus Thermoplasmatota archaeon]
MDALEVLLVIEGIAVLAFAAFLLRRGSRTASTGFLAATLVLFGACATGTGGSRRSR